MADVQWWGILRPEQSTEEVASAADRAGIHWHGSYPDALTLRWTASEDLNEALARLHDAIGVDPGYFRPGFPKRV